MTKAQQIEIFINEQLSGFIEKLNSAYTKSKQEFSGIVCEDDIESVYKDITELTSLCLEGEIYINRGMTLDEILLDITSKPRYQNDIVLSFLQQLLLQANQKFKGDIAPLLINALSKAIDNLNSVSSPGEEDEINLPDTLNTPQAHELWKKAKESGLVDDKYQPKGSQYDAALLADRMGEVLGLKANRRWAPFIKFWNIPYLRQRYQEAPCQHDYADKVKKIRKIIC